MSADSGGLVVLDTSVLVHLARNDENGKAIEEEHQLSQRSERPLISTVAEGEILGLALYWGWGERKLQALRQLLDQLVAVDAGLPEIVNTYAALYAVAARTGKARAENDLWIAATAKVMNAELFTCDKDFLWLDPKHIAVRLIEERP